MWMALCSTVLIKQGMNFNVEDDVAGFLVIKRLDNNKIAYTQTGLTKRIIEAMGIVSANQKATPAETEALPRDKKRNTTEASLNYASIVGMLQYLQGHTGQTLHLQSVYAVGIYIGIQICTLLH